MRDLFRRGAIVGLCLIAGGCASAQVATATACPSNPIPPGARELNLTKTVINLCPKVSDIALDGKGRSVLYNGTWWNPEIPTADHYQDSPDGSLSIALGGRLTTVSRDMKPGKLPLLSGKHKFYVEFEAYISENLKDHWPALWLMPIEHNVQHDDHRPGESKKYERWLEIDVDEGGFAPGPMATAIAWEGVWPNYKRTRSNPNLRNDPIDRTQKHIFGVGYDPQSLTLSFWHNNKLQYVAKPPAIPEIARDQNFYIIMSAQTKGKKLPYTMNVVQVRAYADD
jgi:hypothetical protein